MAMDFKKATDELLACISHQELADALEVSISSVRQARLGETAKARRNPPEGWERTIKKLAEKKAQHFQRLAEKLGSL